MNLTAMDIIATMQISTKMIIIVSQRIIENVQIFLSVLN